MAKKRDVEKIARAYLRSLSKKVIIERAILFGSYAKGEPHAYSDIDLALISPNFKPSNHIQTIRLLWREAAKVNSAIEPLPFSSKEYKYADPRSILGEIKRSGKVLSLK